MRLGVRFADVGRHRAYAYRDFVDSADLREVEEKLFEKKMAYLRSESRRS